MQYVSEGLQKVLKYSNYNFEVISKVINYGNYSLNKKKKNEEKPKKIRNFIYSSKVI